MNAKAVGYWLGGITAIVLCVVWMAQVGASPSYAGDIKVANDPLCNPVWEVIPSPNVGDHEDSLNSIAVVSPSDIWAAGHYRDTLNVSHTMTQHWDGNSWAIVPSPSISPTNSFLQGIDAVASNDVWAVGYYPNQSGIRQTLIEHWNGSSWSVVPSPNPGSRGTVYDGTRWLAG
jgi:hypothetical protein